MVTSAVRVSRLGKDESILRQCCAHAGGRWVGWALALHVTGEVARETCGVRSHDAVRSSHGGGATLCQGRSTRLRRGVAGCR